MPIYSFRDTETDEKVELHLSFSQYDELRATMRDGVLDYEGRTLRRDIPSDIGGRRNFGDIWPLTSDAAGIHPEDIPKFRDLDRQHGVPTEYTRDGSPIFTSKSHRDRYLRLHKLHDKRSWL